VITQLDNNQLNISTVIAVIVNIAVIIIDRIIYRRWEPPQAIRSTMDASGRIVKPAASTEAPAAERPHAEFSTLSMSASHQSTRPTLEEDSSDDDEGDEGKHGGGCFAWLPPVAPALKLILHVTLAITLHVIVFFGDLPAWVCPSVECVNLNPQDEHPKCTRNGAVTFFYLLCCLYLWLSARQLKAGFPLIVLEHPLTDSSSLMALYVNSVFMNFPFLWEFRMAVDWTFTPNTALSLFMWITLEDIYQGLCSTRLAMKGRRQMRKGASQPLYLKILLGGSLIALMLLVSVGPLIIFSPANPIQTENALTKAQASLYANIGTNTNPQIVDGARIDLGLISRFRLTSQLPALEQQTLTNRFGEWATTWWDVNLASATENQWLINNATLEALRSALLPGQGLEGQNKTVSLNVELTLSRYSGRNAVIKLVDDHVLTPLQREQMLQATDPAYTNPVGIMVDTPNFPQVVRLPNSDSSAGSGDTSMTPVLLERAPRDVTFLRSISGAGSTNVQQFWSLDLTGNGINATHVPNSFEDGIQLRVASDTLAASAFAQIGAGGIVAFYTIIFLGAFNIIRGFTAGSRYRIFLDELPDARDLVDLCDGVYIARRGSDLRREFSLYETILRLYRSPEALLALTGGDLKYD